MTRPLNPPFPLLAALVLAVGAGAVGTTVLGAGGDAGRPPGPPGSATRPATTRSTTTRATSLPAKDERAAKALVLAARSHLAALLTALDLYELDNGRYPEALQALVAAPPGAAQWRGPYVKALPADPWGRPYRYRFPGVRNKMGPDLWSAGPDGADDTRDDVSNFERP